MLSIWLITFLVKPHRASRTSALIAILVTVTGVPTGFLWPLKGGRVDGQNQGRKWPRKCPDTRCSENLGFRDGLMWRVNVRGAKQLHVCHNYNPQQYIFLRHNL